MNINERYRHNPDEEDGAFEIDIKPHIRGIFCL